MRNWAADGDGVIDGWEYKESTNPLDSSDYPVKFHMDLGEKFLLRAGETIWSSNEDFSLQFNDVNNDQPGVQSSVSISINGGNAVSLTIGAKEQFEGFLVEIVSFGTVYHVKEASFIVIELPKPISEDEPSPTPAPSQSGVGATTSNRLEKITQKDKVQFLVSGESSKQGYLEVIDAPHKPKTIKFDNEFMAECTVSLLQSCVSGLMGTGEVSVDCECWTYDEVNSQMQIFYPHSEHTIEIDYGEETPTATPEPTVTTTPTATPEPTATATPEPTTTPVPDTGGVNEETTDPNNEETDDGFPLLYVGVIVLVILVAGFFFFKKKPLNKKPFGTDFVNKKSSLDYTNEE